MDSIQSTIEAIKSRSLSEHELLDLLKDKRALVRANVLMALPNIRLTNPTEMVDAVIQAANDPEQSRVRLLGTTTQKRLALATLCWLSYEHAQKLFSDEIKKLIDSERIAIENLVKKGPIA